MNDVNKQTNKQTGRIERNFWIQDTATNRQYMEKEEILAARDRISFGEIRRLAWTEYLDRHFPGNNQLPLDHWQPGGPEFSEAAREKLEKDPGEQLPAVPDFARMADQEILEVYQDPRTDDALRQIARFHMNRRGIEP